MTAIKEFWLRMHPMIIELYRADAPYGEILSALRLAFEPSLSPGQLSGEIWRMKRAGMLAPREAPKVAAAPKRAELGGAAKVRAARARAEAAKAEAPPEPLTVAAPPSVVAPIVIAPPVPPPKPPARRGHCCWPTWGDIKTGLYWEALHRGHYLQCDEPTDAGRIYCFEHWKQGTSRQHGGTSIAQMTDR